MAKIIRFPVEKAAGEKEEVQILDGATAEIIIFPGIRFERHAGSGAGAVASK
jgi:hypothetical protein